jgi:N-acetyl-1-D-myo-inositol-2-amino-2-deoxy-alpha-D-glucopyranoside deacetylase
MSEIDYSHATLLSVLAHPDDETFGTGGTLALYSKRGAAVHLVCATRGEVGDVPPEMMAGFSSVAELRESELRCAAGHLGLKEVYFLEYRDSGMPGSPDNLHPNALAAQPVEEVAAKVVSYIRKLKPQVVITFDPIGGYHHPDHIAIHKATVLAFKLAADPAYEDSEHLPAFQADRLFFQTISHTFMKVAVVMSRLAGRDPSKFGRNGDIDLAAIAKEDFPIHARIDYHSVVEQRTAASYCHASQGGKEMATGIQKILQRLFQADELFMQAYPSPAPKQAVRDLFSGVNLP